MLCGLCERVVLYEKKRILRLPNYFQNGTQ